mgnify:CR=1 FL=1
MRVEPIQQPPNPNPNPIMSLVSVLFAAALIGGCYGIDCKNVTAVAGNVVKLDCVSLHKELANWDVLYATNTRRRDIARLARIVRERQARFAVQLTSTGGYNLFIVNAQIEDTGEYQCIEDEGTGATVACYNLNVTAATTPAPLVADATSKLSPSTGATAPVVALRPQARSPRW